MYLENDAENLGSTRFCNCVLVEDFYAIHLCAQVYFCKRSTAQGITLA